MAKQRVFGQPEGVTIGKKVLFADKISIIANEHNYKDIHKPIMEQGCSPKAINIGDGTWIGIEVTILSGTNIGKNCVVAAGAVVKGNFPDYSVIGGVPAKIIRQYNEEGNVWKKGNM